MAYPKKPDRALPRDEPYLIGDPQPRDQKIGVLLVNLGSPVATDYWSIRRYLKEFLSDQRVIDKPRITWWPVLNFIILSTRPQKSGKAYRAIWNDLLNESPLLTTTRAQALKLAKAFEDITIQIKDDQNRTPPPGLLITWGMRYAEPSIKQRIDQLIKAGASRILIVPLYPQYSTSTSATVADQVFKIMLKMRKQPTLRIAPPYYHDPSYIQALANSINNTLERLDFIPEKIIASFHGIPVEYCQKGDWYCQHCHTTVGLLKQRLGAIGDRVILTFQSRFGPGEWLQPYTNETIKTLAQSGLKSLLVITPGFAADCIETLEEIAVGSAELFANHGGQKFALIPCLNDSPDAIAMLTAIVSRELAGWWPIR